MSKRRGGMGVTYIATCLLWFSIYVYSPILSPYSEGIGASYSMVGSILGAYGLMQLICRIPIGVWSDRINKRGVFRIFGMACGGLAGLGMFFASTPGMLVVFRALAGIAASTWAIYMVSYTNLYPPEKQSHAMGVISTSMFGGQLAANFLGGVIASAAGERMAFLAAALSGAVGVLLLCSLPEPPSERRAPPSASDFLGLLKNRNLLFFSLMAVVMQIAFFAGALGFIPNVLRGLGADNFVLGLNSTLATVPAVITSFFSGHIEKKFGAKASLCCGFILLAGTLLAMAFPDKSVAFILAMVFVSGFPKGLMQPLLNSLAIRTTAPSVRSAASSMFQAIYALGMTLGPIVTGAIADSFGMAEAFIAVGCLTLLPSVAFLIKKEYPKGVS